MWWKRWIRPHVFLSVPVTHRPASAPGDCWVQIYTTGGGEGHEQGAGKAPNLPELACMDKSRYCSSFNSLNTYLVLPGGTLAAIHSQPVVAAASDGSLWNNYSLVIPVTHHRCTHLKKPKPTLLPSSAVAGVSSKATHIWTPFLKHLYISRDHLSHRNGSEFLNSSLPQPLCWAEVFKGFTFSGLCSPTFETMGLLPAAVRRAQVAWLHQFLVLCHAAIS